MSTATRATVGHIRTRYYVESKGRKGGRNPRQGRQKGGPKIEWHEHDPEAVINQRVRYLEPEAELWLAVLNQLIEDTERAEKLAAKYHRRHGGNTDKLKPVELLELASFWADDYGLEELCDRVNAACKVEKFRAVEIRRHLAPAVAALPGLVERFGG